MAACTESASMIWSRSCSLRRIALLPAFSKRENIASTSRWSCFSSAIVSVRPLERLRGAPVALRVDGAALRAAVRRTLRGLAVRRLLTSSRPIARDGCSSRPSCAPSSSPFSR